MIVFQDYYHDDLLFEELVRMFEKANQLFLHGDSKSGRHGLLFTRVSERTLCGELKSKLELIKANPTSDMPLNLSKYFVDVEYNRNDGRVKTIIDDDLKVVTINCDLILHSRGLCIEQDNLIALEMKKSSQPKEDKQSDKDRLIALTKSDFNDQVWSYDGKTLPEHVCRYILGIYYEVNYNRQKILVEYYRRGRYLYSKIFDFAGKYLGEFTQINTN